MKIIRTSISLFLLLIMLILSLTLIICIDFNRTIFSAEFIKSAVHKTNSYSLVYNQIPPLISGLLPSTSSTTVSRFVINNVSERGLISQTDTIIDNFYSYLGGINNTPAIDLSTIKKEIASIKLSERFRAIESSRSQFNSYSIDIPSKIKINDPSVENFIGKLSVIFNIFRYAPYFLGALLILGWTLLIFMNKWTGNLRLYISSYLIGLGILLGLLYSLYGLASGFYLPQALSHLQYTEFKMLAISLYPVLHEISDSIFNYFLVWSICLTVSGLAVPLSIWNVISRLVCFIINIPIKIKEKLIIWNENTDY